MESADARFERLSESLSCFVLSRINVYQYQKHGIHQDDLYQEILIKIWRTLCGKSEIRDLNSYVRKIVHSVVLDQIRASKKDMRILKSLKRDLLIEQVSFWKIPTSEIDYLGKEAVQLLNNLITSRERTVRLRYLGFTLSEIAQIMGWSKGKTYCLYYRGLKDIKKMLGLDEPAPIRENKIAPNLCTPQI
jgi:RNA polymerase sigma factor (sigma-70 family)